jgi:hypothetical protein
VYTLLIILLASIFLISIFLKRGQLENVYSELNKIFRPAGEKNLTQPGSTTTLAGGENETNATGGAGLPSEKTSQPGNATEGVSEQQELVNVSKALTLEIIDICSGNLENSTSISEGGISKCLNRKYPYYIVLEKNSTHFQTSFYNISGFNETYAINESILIYFVFVEDVASVSTFIQSFQIQGSTYFYFGGYTLYTTWKEDASGNLFISKMTVALPLYVKRDVPATNEWNELKFYLNIPNKNYYLGDLWVLVKEK